MSFEVVPARLVTAGQEITNIADAVDMMTDYLSGHLHINGDSKIFAQFKGEIDKVRTTLVSDYTSKSRAAFVASGGALDAMGQDYAAVDLAQLAAFDALLPDGFEHTSPHGMDPGEATAGYNRSDYAAVLGPPGSAYAGWEDFQAMRDGLDAFLGWDWLFDILGFIGLPDMAQQLNDWLQGDYDSMGKAMEALSQVSTFWALVRDEMAATMIKVDETWSGNAASAAFAWFSTYDDVLAEHARAVSGVHSRLSGYAMALRMTIESLVGLLQSLIDLVFGVSDFPTSWTDVLEWLSQAGAKAILKKLFLIIDAMLILFDAALLVCGLLVMAFSQIAGHGDISLPDDSGSAQASDVDGP